MGQNHVVRSLQNALKSGKFVHAYLFTGPRGTGKTSTARLLAKALCCEKGPSPEPCNECDICRGITDGSLMDVQEFDAASESGVDDIRNTIVEVANYVPTQARFKVYIIDEVHDLSSKAFDALLKTVEEPPPHLVFVLATTEYHKVPPTIRSRCQKFEFHRGSVQEIVGRLEYVAKAEGVEIEPAALSAIARMADGGYRDALNLFEQAMLTSEGAITLAHVYDQLGLIDEEAVDALLLAIKSGDMPKIVELVTEFGRLGRDPRAILESALLRLADLTRASLEVGDVKPGDGAREAAMFETAQHLGRDATLSLRGSLSEAHLAIREVTLPRIWLESELLRIALALQQPAPATKQEPRSHEVKPKPQEPARATVPPELDAGKLKPAEPAPQPPAASTDKPPAHRNGDAGESAVALVEEATDDPGLARARQVWREVVEGLKQGAKNPALVHKLASTRVAVFNSGKLTVEFARKIDRDGICEGTNGPGRIAKLLECVREQAGEDWVIEYTVATKSQKAVDPPTVELPAEGAKLLEMTKEIFPGS